MPEHDQIPEINDEPPVDIPDEHDNVRIVMSDDEATFIGHEELVAIKGIPVTVPSIATLKDHVERPISPPATPSTEASDYEVPTINVVEALQTDSHPEIPVVDIVPDKHFALDEEPSKDVTEKAAEVTLRTVEAAAKAVEEHAKIVEDAASPTELTDESSKPSDDLLTSEFVVVPAAVVEEDKVEPSKPIEEAPTIVHPSHNAPLAELSTSEPESESLGKCSPICTLCRDLPIIPPPQQSPSL
jgi:hypothetical protein